jgi:PAS domain S-box-containing protein
VTNLRAEEAAPLSALTVERDARQLAELELAHRADRLQRTSETLQRAAQVVAKLGSDEVECVQELTRLCAQALDVTRAALWRRSPDSNLVQMVTMFDRASDRYLDGLTLSTLDYPEYWEALTRDRRIAVFDAATDPRTRKLYTEHMSHLERVAMLDVGIRVHDQTMGLFSFHQVNPSHAWSPEDEILVLAVADLVALTFERFGRIDAERGQRARTERLLIANSALARMAASSAVRAGELEQAFRELTEWSAEALSTSRVGIWLSIPNQPGKLELSSQFLAKERVHVTGESLLRADYPEYFRALLSERSLAASDAQHDARTRELGGYLRAHNVVSLLDAPVRSRGEFVGVVCFEQVSAPRVWSVEEILFAGAVSDLVSLSLESAARIQAERETEESRERLRLLISGTPLAAIDWNHAGRIIGWNPAAERIFGYSASEMIGGDGYAIVPEADRPRAAKARSLLFAGHASEVARASNRRHDGSAILCDWRNTVLWDSAGRVIGVTSLVEDVTERVRAEEEVRRLNSSLEQRVLERTQELGQANEKLREVDRLKTEFLATMSHELRTPLNSIIGFSGILKARMAGDVNAEQERQLEMIHSSAKHLLGLINDILDVSRIEVGKMRLSASAFEPLAVLKDVEKTLEPLVAVKGLKFEIEDNSQGAVVVGDRSRFFQVVINLANNAVKFTERGSVRLCLSSQGARLVVDVIDTGPGIQQAHLAQLFEAFRQVDGSARRTYEGTGLGLYLSRKLATLLGGEISAESEWGRGSRFSFWVPKTPAPAPSQLEEALP